jgi:hypothetical protein
MNRLAIFAAILVGMTGVAHAQPMNSSTETAPHHRWHRTMAQSCGNHVAITDEYGFRYDSQGDRLNAQGCVIPPPHTRPGAKAIQG